MLRWVRMLDELLRGERTREAVISRGEIDLPLRVFIPLAIALGAIYGFFMGWYAITERSGDGAMQAVAAIVKLPLLFLLTLLVSFPSLYVFNALVGCRLGFMAALRLAVAAIVVSLAVAASLGPILAFFTLSTTSYPFMVALNVALLGIAGAIGLGFLLSALRRLAAAGAESAVEPTVDPAAVADGGRLRRQREQEGLRAAGNVFRVWVLIYALVGAQMGWLLRPFIGSPDLPFTWFRNREGNFILGLLHHLRTLFEL